MADELFRVEFDGERMNLPRPKRPSVENQMAAYDAAERAATRSRSELAARLRERAQSREDEQKRTGERGERIALYNLRCRNDARLMREAADALDCQT